MGKSPCYSWVNQPFLWPVSSSQTAIEPQRAMVNTHRNNNPNANVVVTCCILYSHSYGMAWYPHMLWVDYTPRPIVLDTPMVFQPRRHVQPHSASSMFHVAHMAVAQHRRKALRGGQQVVVVHLELGGKNMGKIVVEQPRTGKNMKKWWLNNQKLEKSWQNGGWTIKNEKKMEKTWPKAPKNREKWVVEPLDMVIFRNKMVQNWGPP